MPPKTHVPSVPKVISPSPTPAGEDAEQDSYFPPTTRSTARRSTRLNNSSSSNGKGSESPPDSNPDARARVLSRSPTRTSTAQRRRKSGIAPLSSSGVVKRSQPLKSNGHTPNGHLSPLSAMGPGSPIVRSAISRSPSPLGLIPLHTHWRSFIHRHEIPRKALHVSIGFFTLRLYTLGIQPPSIHPWLLGAAIPIASVDFLRHRWPPFNRLYVRLLGALMRESEVHEKYNGVIWYLVGTWAAMRFMPKDIGVMSILLLSWCDTAASTIGRRFGRYTPQVRRGKSFAGTAAACFVGISTALLWWGYIAPKHFGTEDSFMFKGYLQAPSIPRLLEGTSSLSAPQGAPRATGWLALGVISIWSGIVASVSEAVDIFGWDDNLTIPILSGIGLWSFLKVFG